MPWKPGGDTEEQWRASLRDYVYPKIGDKTVNKITTTDVMHVDHRNRVFARRGGLREERYAQPLADPRCTASAPC